MSRTNRVDGVRHGLGRKPRIAGQPLGHPRSRVELRRHLLQRCVVDLDRRQAFCPARQQHSPGIERPHVPRTARQDRIRNDAEMAFVAGGLLCRLRRRARIGLQRIGLGARLQLPRTGVAHRWSEYRDAVERPASGQHHLACLIRPPGRLQPHDIIEAGRHPPRPCGVGAEREKPPGGPWRRRLPSPELEPPETRVFVEGTGGNAIGASACH